MKGWILIAILVLLLSTPVLAATVEKTQTRTTTAELSNGAWNSGGTIADNQIYLTAATCRYISDEWYIPNSTNGDVNFAKGNGANRLDYAWVSGNKWLNSSDFRKEFTGDASKSIRYSFDVWGTTSDGWFVNSSTVNDATAGGTGLSMTDNSGRRSYTFGGAAYVLTSYTYEYGGSWSAGGMFYPTAGGGTVFSLGRSSGTGYINLRYVDNGASDYFQLREYSPTASLKTLSSGAYSNSAWHYVYLYHDGATDTYYFYVDGDYIGSLAGYTGSMPYDRICIGGAYAGSFSDGYTGYVSDFFFHDGGEDSTSRALKGSSTGPIKTYYNVETSGAHASYLTNYNLPSTSGNIYTVVFSELQYDYNYCHDISISYLNTYPSITGMSPEDEYIYETDPSVILSVDVSDPDISYFPTMYAEFYVDGEYEGVDDRSGNGGISYNVGSYTGGTHTWKARVYSTALDYIWSSEYEFNVKSVLYIRDEENPDELIDDATVTVNFYTENLSLTKSSDNGTINLSGLPIQNILVTASADGYTSRKTIITNLYDTQNIYMINSTSDIIYQKFVLNVQTISGSPTDYILKIQKPMNGTIDTVFSSYFDFDGSCGTYLIETDVYQLVIVAPDGSESAYGYLYPDPDGQIDIAYQGISFNEYVNAWLSTNTTIDRDAMSITYAYEEAAQDNSLNPISVTEATMVITDANDNAVYNVTVTDSSYVFQYSTINEGRYTVNVEILGEDADGVEFSYTKSFVVDFIDDHFQFMPDAYPEWLKMLIVTFLCIFVLVAFGGYRSDLAAGLSFGLYAFSAYQEWISVGSLALGVMFIIVMAAFFKLQRNIKRTG